MARTERGTGDAMGRAAVSSVAAYLADEDADVYNIIDAAAREDGLGLALNLTALAAKAMTELATATGHTPMEVLRSMESDGPALRASGWPRDRIVRSPDGETS
ncbi:hypothetical protein AB0J82_36445 [Asanoa sp. NPDC049518]|uniref:hypothetical protein n=1 Tax=unclassified Asanoa TaxID=2685164 RepID=UPI003442FFE1